MTPDQWDFDNQEPPSGSGDDLFRPDALWSTFSVERLVWCPHRWYVEACESAANRPASRVSASRCWLPAFSNSATPTPSSVPPSPTSLRQRTNLTQNLQWVGGGER